MTLRIQAPVLSAFVVLVALGCSSSNDSSGCGGSSSTQRCEINANATVCGDQITLECFDGATPEADSQCELALEQDTEAIFCCTSAVEEAELDEGLDAIGGGGGAP